MLSKLHTCSAVNTASVKTLTTRKRRKRSMSKSWHYFFLQVASFDERQLFCAQINIELIHNEISILFAKNRYTAIFDRNTFISVIFSLMCACSRISKKSRVEIYLWKDRVISSILDQISIVFFLILKKKRAKDRNF